MGSSDFSNRKWFPGTFGGPFDVLINLADRVEQIPWPLFALVLLGLAALPSRGSLIRLGVLLLFFLSDWAIVACLPRAGKSFGPAKPPVLLMALLRFPFAYLPPAWFLVVQAGGSLLALYAYWFEPQRLQLTRQLLVSPKLPRGRKITVLHLADLHLERITDRERALTRLICELKPDLILFSGDFLNLSYILDPAAWADVRTLLEEWKAPAGVFAVAGSPPVDQPEVLPHLLEGFGHIRLLHGEKNVVACNGIELELVGVDCSHKPFVDAPKMRALLESSPPGRFTVFLYHSPDLAPDAAEAGADLMLCGHTHGGQVRLPWAGAIYASSLYGKRFEAGRYPLGDMTLYVSRGLGMEGRGAPRVRFLCRPEATLWEISGPADGAARKPSH